MYGAPTLKSQHEFDAQVLMFSSDPLAVMINQTNIIDGVPHFSRIFDSFMYSENPFDPEPSSVVNPIILNLSPDETEIKLANEICQYFRNELSIKKLSGFNLSEWEMEFLKFDKMRKNNSCLGKHLRMFCKLPSFYATNEKLDKLIEEHTSAPLLNNIEHNNLYAGKVNLTVKPVCIVQYNDQRRKSKSVIYFSTKNNYLIELICDKNTILENVVNACWTEFQQVTMNLYYVPTVKGNYYRSTRLDFSTH